MSARTILIVLSVALVVPAIIGLLIIIGGVLSRSSLRSQVRDLYEARATSEPDLVSEPDLDGLPEPVQRWLRRSNVVGRARVKTVRLRQRGRFRQGKDRPWMPFTAQEYYTTDPPTFLWRAMFRIAGLPIIEVRDSYRDGKGNTLVRLGSVITIGNERGPEMDQGAMLRYLNEIMWFPSAALSDYIQWNPIDSGSARATMRYGSLVASAVFYFDEAGNFTNMVAERYGKFGDTYSLEQWSTPVSEYGEFDGVRVPIRGEGIWKLESGGFTYIRLEATGIEYDAPMPY